MVTYRIPDITKKHHNKGDGLFELNFQRPYPFIQASRNLSC